MRNKRYRKVGTGYTGEVYGISVELYALRCTPFSASPVFFMYGGVL